MFRYLVIAAVVLLQMAPALAQDPELPEGLFDDPFAAPIEQNEPDALDEQIEPGAPLPFDFGGFWEARSGMRLVDDKTQRSASLTETRLQLKLAKDFDAASVNLVGDLVYDHLADQYSIDLEKGLGVFDLREANLVASLADNVDIKLGRQTLTWGTGDLVFINDLFPKDWNSFFLGRDVEYLKAPSDALKASLYSNLVNLDVIYTPRFDADRFLDGRRVSYYSASSDNIVGRPGGIVNEDKPSDDEISLRAYRNIAAYEVALYGYHGRWKSPQGQNAVTGNSTFPVLDVLGGSVRGPLASGIANLEAGYYDSRDDSSGSNSLIRNSETRFLVGYEQEAARNLTLGLQWYLEHMLDYSDYQNALAAGAKAKDKNRHLLSTRLTWLTHSQNVVWSLFAFYSPTDKDIYLRPRVSYKIDDFWTVETGGNIFYGEDKHTFFGQFRDNTNAYVSLRYGF